MVTETEKKILIAARKEFEEKGFNGSRMQNIATLAGMSKPSLHYYFRTKENLFKKIFDEALEEYMPLVNTWVNDNLSWEEKIKLFTNELVKYVHKGHLLFLIREIYRNPDLLEDRVKKSKTPNKFVNYFDDIMLKKNIRQTDARVLFIMVHSICSFPVLNSRMFQKTLRMSEKQYNELMQSYAKTAAELIINAIKK